MKQHYGLLLGEESVRFLGVGVNRS